MLDELNIDESIATSVPQHDRSRCDFLTHAKAQRRQVHAMQGFAQPIATNVTYHLCDFAALRETSELVLGPFVIGMNWQNLPLANGRFCGLSFQSAFAKSFSRGA
jgi:hypothetical protein